MRTQGGTTDYMDTIPARLAVYGAMFAFCCASWYGVIAGIQFVFR